MSDLVMVSIVCSFICGFLLFRHILSALHYPPLTLNLVDVCEPAFSYVWAVIHQAAHAFSGRTHFYFFSANWHSWCCRSLPRQIRTLWFREQWWNLSLNSHRCVFFFSSARVAPEFCSRLILHNLNTRDKLVFTNLIAGAFVRCTKCFYSGCRVQGILHSFWPISRTQVDIYGGNWVCRQGQVLYLGLHAPRHVKKARRPCPAMRARSLIFKQLKCECF